MDGGFSDLWCLGTRIRSIMAAMVSFAMKAFSHGVMHTRILKHAYATVRGRLFQSTLASFW